MSIIAPNNYVLYVCDTETTGFDFVTNDVIEVSFYRLSDEVQKTWCIKPFNTAAIGADALRVNGHKYEDLTHETKYGREVYREAKSVIIDIENFIEEDNVPSEQRILVGQNVQFDKNMLEQLWTKCGSRGSFPFGRKTLDTMQLQFAMDFCSNNMSQSYSLNALTKKYGVKNDKAHSAASDTLSTKDVFLKQMNFLKSKLHARP